MPPRNVFHLTHTGVKAIAAGAVLLVVLVTYMLVSHSMRGPKVNLMEILAVSINLARRAGEEVRRVQIDAQGSNEALGIQVKSRTKEGADELVTAGDRASHRIMLNGFRQTFPDVAVISEEHTHHVSGDSPQSKGDHQEVGEGGLRKGDVDYSPPRDLSEEDLSHIRGSAEHVYASDVTIWLDPLDATQEYTENLTEYVTTMICVAVKGVPVIGVIYRPFVQQTVWAWLSHGSSPNLRHHDSAREERLKYKIIVSRSHAGSVKALMHTAFGDQVETVAAGGAGYKILQVIRGNADAYLHVTNIKKWDICAGNVLLDASYGRLTTLKGHFIDYSSDAPTLIEDGLVATIGDHVHGLHAMFLERWALSIPKLKEK